MDIGTGMAIAAVVLGLSGVAVMALWTAGRRDPNAELLRLLSAWHYEMCRVYEQQAVLNGRPLGVPLPPADPEKQLADPEPETEERTLARM